VDLRLPVWKYPKSTGCYSDPFNYIDTGKGGNPSIWAGKFYQLAALASIGYILRLIEWMFVDEKDRESCIASQKVKIHEGYRMGHARHPL